MRSETNLIDFLKGAASVIIEGGEQPTPILLVEREGESADFMMLAVEGHPIDAIKNLAPQVVVKGSIERVSLLTDSYLYIAKGSIGNLDTHPGDLQVRFEAGDPNTFECLAIAVVTRGDTERGAVYPSVSTAMYRFPYKRDGEMVEWLTDMDDSHEQISGRVPEVLTALIKVSVDCVRMGITNP